MRRVLCPRIVKTGNCPDCDRKDWPLRKVENGDEICTPCWKARWNLDDY